MKVSRKWILWAHTPPAESDVAESVRLCDMAEQSGRGAIEITDPALVAELISVAECYRNPKAGDALFDMGPWWRGQPRKVIEAGRAALRAAEKARQANSLSCETIANRLARLRARRRRLGWFDYSSDSWDMRTTQARALRIYLRLMGRRCPLECVHSGRPLPWNSYHS